MRFEADAGDDWYLYASASGDRATGVIATEAGEAVTNTR